MNSIFSSHANREMLSIDGLFAQKAHALTTGDIATLSEGFVCPTSIYLGDRIIYIRDRSVLIAVLSRFRENLVHFGYTATRFANITRQILGPRSVRVTLDWTDLGADGRELSSRVACFYCTRCGDAGWRITLINFHTAPEPELLLGLPVL